MSMKLGPPLIDETSCAPKTTIPCRRMTGAGDGGFVAGSLPKEWIE